MLIHRIKNNGFPINHHRETAQRSRRSSEAGAARDRSIFTAAKAIMPEAATAPLGGRFLRYGLGSRLGIALLLALMLGANASEARAEDSDAAIAKRLRDAALKDDWGYRYLETLTTTVGQRLAATEAEARAAGWAESMFKKAGFEAVHRESVPMTLWQRGREEAEIVTPSPQRLVVTALGGSVATPADGIKAILAGAHGVQLVSAVLRHGPGYPGVMRDGLAQWMSAHEFAALTQVRGTIDRARDTDLAERGSYIRTLQSWTISAADG